jgi:hypothetical protein
VALSLTKKEEEEEEEEEVCYIFHEPPIVPSLTSHMAANKIKERERERERKKEHAYT